MKKISTLAACLILASMILLAGPGTAKAQKVGFVNLKEVVLESEPGDKMEADFKKAYEKKRTQIQQKETELKKLKDELEKQRSVLNAEAFREKENSYQTKFRDYQRLVKDSNDELVKKEQEMAAKILPEVVKVIQAMGEKEGYSAVLDVNNPVVIYRAKGNDLTKKAIEEVNKAFKGKK